MEPLDFMDPDPPIEVQKTLSAAHRNWSDEIMALTGGDIEHGVHEQIADGVDVELTALHEQVESLLEDLENAYIDRTQLLGAVRFAVDSLPETSQNIRVRAKLEMALTDLVATYD